jgi:hypothetical protein
VRSRDELTGRIERGTKSHNELPNFVQRKIIVRLIPETDKRAIGLV